MRIAFVTTTFPSLSQTFILNQITGLLDLGHDLHIFAFNDQGEKFHPEVKSYHLLNRTTYLKKPPVNRVSHFLEALSCITQKACLNPEIMTGLNPLKHGLKALNIKRLFEAIPFLEKEPYDIIHSHFANTGRIMAGIIPYIPHKVFLTSMYGHDVTRKSQTAEGINKELIKKGDAFLPLGQTMADQLISLGFPGEKIITHAIGIEPWKFEFRERRYTQGRQINLLTIARLVEKKGIAYGLKALAGVLEGSRLPVRYRLVGDGPLREELERLAKELGIKNQVEFLGWKNQDEVKELFRISDIFMLPSVTASDGDQEGTPVSLMEAQAMGLPVLSTIHSGIPEIIHHGKSGYLVRERDVDGLAERLRHLITHTEEWPVLGRAGRQLIEHNHNVAGLNKKLVEIYEGLILEKTGK